MRCISNGAKLCKYGALALIDYDKYDYCGPAWIKVDNRAALVLVGTNDADAGNSNPAFEADIIPYTGVIEHKSLGLRWVFKNGYLHDHQAQNGFYLDEPKKTAENWALQMFERFWEKNK